MSGFTGYSKAQLLENSDGILLADSGKLRHQTAISSVSALLMPDSSASTINQSLIALRIASIASGLVDP